VKHPDKRAPISAAGNLKGAELKNFLDQKAEQYNCVDFIKDDPISIPHLFTKKQDIEISGFFAAVLAWGIRKTIISKCKELMERMDWAPHDFILNYKEKDLLKLQGFKHRTFNTTDLFYFLEWFQWYYRRQDSLEDAFARHISPDDDNAEKALTGFHDLFFSLPEAPQRTRKHVATPARKSSCKRINMYLRWMVRKDDKGVDFGLWNRMKPSQLLCPVDLHVERVARALGLINKPQVNWQGTVDLTNHLKAFDPVDPVRYDFALFGLGIMEKFGKE
jgi:uncharacterized protein (TIGR02757 family)